MRAVWARLPVWQAMKDDVEGLLIFGVKLPVLIRVDQLVLQRDRHWLAANVVEIKHSSKTNGWYIFGQSVADGSMLLDEPL